MSAITRTPKNTNFLQPSKFLLTFNRIPDVQYQCHQVNLPGASLGTVTRETPFLDIYSPGTKLTYQTLELDFYIDEELLSWKNIMDWFYSIANPDGFEKRDGLNDYKETRTPNLRHLSDATLTVLSNLNNPIVRIEFVNVFPTTLSDLTFDTQQSADTIMTAHASFRYDYYKIIPA